MGRPYALLRSGFPYYKTLGMRRVTSNAVDVGWGSDGIIYVLCRGSLGTEIRRINLEDENLGIVGTGSLTCPAALLVDREENFYVSDEATHTVSVFSKDGELLGSWGENGDGDGQLNGPSGMAFDAEENIYVADTLNHRIQKFTKDGQFMMSFGHNGDGDGEFNMPWGIAVDELGEVYIADWRNDRIQKLGTDGQFLFKFGASGDNDGQFNRPSGVAVDQDGDIYVADWGNNRVQLFDSEGRYVEKFRGDANLSESARAYILSNAVTLRLREMAQLEPARRLRAPTSVKVDDERRLFVTDTGSHRIQIYKKDAYPLEEHQLAPKPRNPVLFTV